MRLSATPRTGGTLAALGMATLSALAAIAACGDNSNQPPDQSSYDAAGSTSSVSGSSGTTARAGSTSSGSTSPSGSPSSTDATLPAVRDAGSGIPGADALVMYDGTPSQVVTEGGLGCATP